MQIFQRNVNLRENFKILDWVQFKLLRFQR